MKEMPKKRPASMTDDVKMQGFPMKKKTITNAVRLYESFLLRRKFP
jgi:hypothetical protein